jgi:hypothetical protein
LSCATEKGRDTLFDAINKRQDDVYRPLYDEFNSLSLVPLNLERVFIVDTEASLLVLLHSATSLTNRCKFLLLSYSKTYATLFHLKEPSWDYCIFCRQKAIKKDRKLKRIESSERVKYILNAARGKFDYDLLSLLTVDSPSLFVARS